MVRVAFGRRVFAPSWPMTLLTVLLCAAFVALGRWQWRRGEHRAAEWAAFARGADRALPDPGDFATLPAFQRIRVSGQLDAEHQFLLDNRTHAGRAGYEVLTPLALEDGRVLLVDRGWVAFTGYRARLPDVRLEAPGIVTLTGRIDTLPAAGLALGRMPPDRVGPWPRVTSYPQMGELAQALGHALAARILLLDPQAPFGYVRDWQPPGLSPARHWSYAVQWWGFAATLFVIWVVLSSRESARVAR